MLIQSTGLARRMLAAKTERLVIGLSGGLDSTLAFQWREMLWLNCHCPQILECSPLPAPEPLKAHLQMLTDWPKTWRIAARNRHQCVGSSTPSDLEHEGARDVVFENAQARRTQILFNYANKVGGIVVGTGDLSELALGWATFSRSNGEHNVNANVPKPNGLFSPVVRPTSGGT